MPIPTCTIEFKAYSYWSNSSKSLGYTTWYRLFISFTLKWFTYIVIAATSFETLAVIGALLSLFFANTCVRTSTFRVCAQTASPCRRHHFNSPEWSARFCSSYAVLLHHVNHVQYSYSTNHGSRICLVFALSERRSVAVYSINTFDCKRNLSLLLVNSVLCTRHYYSYLPYFRDNLFLVVCVLLTLASYFELINWLWKVAPTLLDLE